MTAKKPDAEPNIWRGMSAERFKEIGEYARCVADRIGLRDWTITMSRSALGGNDDALGHVCCTYGQRRATVSLARDFDDQDPEMQRHCLVHELLHCVHEPMFARLRNSLTKAMGQQTYDVLMESIVLDAEYANDALTDFIAPRFPLIGDEWPEDL